MFALRWYQQEAVDSLFQYFSEKSGNPILALPTGVGKSLCAAGFIKEVFRRYPGQRIMLLSHVKEIIQQDAKALLNQWPTAPLGIYSAGLRSRDTISPIIFGGIGSVAKKANLFGHIDLLIIDEAHMVSHRCNTSYVKFIEALKEVNPHLKVIGLTATPYRLGHGLLTDGPIFTDCAYDLTTRESFTRLVKEGFMAQLIAKRTNAELDVSQVHIRGGEYIQKELQEAVNKTAVTQEALREAITLGERRKSWIVFTTGIDHTEDTTKILNSMGVKAVSVHSKLKPKERDAVIADFTAGKYRAIVNPNILTTGFDHPSMDLGIILRPTVSPGLWVQILGRLSRPAPGKEDALILDFAGNTRRLGPIDDPVIPKRKRKGEKGTAPVKVCEQCGVYNHASARCCVNCGFEFHRETKLKTTASTQSVMGKAEPDIQLLPVDLVTYKSHRKIGKPPTLKVTYHCGLRLFHEWVCFEHKGFAWKKAKDWWRKASSEPVPTTVDEALAEATTLAAPNAVRVWLNTKYPKIVGRVFYK